jgi:uncharacterized membrane protein
MEHPMPVETWVFGAWMAILTMAVVSYVCRIFGYAVMAHVPVTPRVQRALNALPGTIVVATLAPAAAKGGFPAIMALAAAIMAKLVFKQDMAAFIAGLGVVIAIRAAGL